jgi:hypothetical protein
MDEYTNRELVDRLLEAAHVGGMASLWPDRRTREAFKGKQAEEARLRQVLLARLAHLEIAVEALRAIAGPGEEASTPEQALAREALLRIQGE